MDPLLPGRGFILDHNRFRAAYIFMNRRRITTYYEPKVTDCLTCFESSAIMNPEGKTLFS